MDFWLAIAAATACYMAKQLKVLQDSKSVKTDASVVEQDDSETCVMSEIVCSHCSNNNNNNNNRKLANISDYYESGNVFSISSLLCDNKFENSLPPEQCRRDKSMSGLSKGRRRNSLSIGRSNVKSTKTICSSLESCLMAQLHNNENIGMEDYVLIPVSSHGDCSSGRKIEARTEEDHPGNLTPTGSSHKSALFILGISLGMISSSLTNRREVDKLNRLLNQTENLVQDLQEELELKDSLTVRELITEDHDSQDAYDSAKGFELSCRKNLNDAPDHDDDINEQQHDQKGIEHSKAIAKIEAELQAELELLELNMSSSSLEGKLTKMVEEKDQDQDFIAGLAEGEIFDGRRDRQPYADRDGSGFSTTHSMHYAVNPHELSLCLHQVIQSKLEDRIRELERALEKSEKKKAQTKHIAMEEEAIVINLSEEASDTKEDTYPSSREQDQDILLDQNQHYIMQCSYSDELPTFCSPENENFEDLGIISEDENDDDDDSHDEEELLIKQIVERARKGSVALINAQKELDKIDQ